MPHTVYAYAIKTDAGEILLGDDAIRYARDNPPFDYLTESARTASGHFHGHLVALSEIEEAFKDFIAATAKMDRIKKLLFYGENEKKGLLKRDELFTETAEASRQILVAEFDMTEQPIPEQNGHRAAEYLLHATLGTATEAGEMVEHLYGVIFEGKPLDLINMREEVFDGQWYDAMFCRVAGITFDQGQRENIAKLRKRFPDKFTTEAANVRDLDAERAVLESNGMYPPAIAAVPMEVEDFEQAVLDNIASKLGQSYEEAVSDYISSLDPTIEVPVLIPGERICPSYQTRVADWMMQCFGADITNSLKERCYRFSEEAGELVQSLGMDEIEWHQIGHYVWNRPVGETHQEIGGVMVTLAALCHAAEDDMDKAGYDELARVSTPEMIDKIRRKHNDKKLRIPTSALPGGID